ncbi:hypothetical protein BTZ20_4475 [Rhodococcus sp. MTM3W5.2]|nr:hypothetical protein BTZ20_4475 [Rhodococcus sp. MTM3W5.2]
MSGVQDAVENRDEWWWAGAMAALKAAAATGREFDSYDLTEWYGINGPDHPARWGGLFASAKKEGLIEPAGFCVSRRPTRSGGITRRWRGRGA